MKLSTEEKRTAVSALSHAIAQAPVNEAWRYVNLRKKLEQAIRQDAVAQLRKEADRYADDLRALA